MTDPIPNILIIGQGIAGTCLAWESMAHGINVTILDRGSEGCASAVSSGLINPITGRHFVKSWMVEKFITAANELYGDAESSIGLNIKKDIEIVRHLGSINTENTWHTKAAMDGYASYMKSGPSVSFYDQFVSELAAFGTVTNAMQIDTSTLLRELRRRWIAEGMLREEWFDKNKLELLEDGVIYDSESYSHIILCMGWRGMQTIFETEVYRPVKGEVLIVRIPEFPTDYLLKYDKFIVPIQDDIFWIGSTYQWDYEDESSDLSKSQELEEFLNGVLKVNYEIISRQAGVRPSTKYRRPLIGRHPKSDHLYLFNGLGTKGVSMAPYWAKRIIEDIQNPNSEKAISEAFGKSFIQT